MSLRSTQSTPQRRVTWIVLGLLAICGRALVAPPAVATGSESAAQSDETARSETATSETATSETATSETASSETATSETATSETAAGENARSAKAAAEGPSSGTPASETGSAAAASAESVAASAACSGGVVKDDGSVDSGYGYVPNAKFGRYVQELHSSELASTAMADVCVCWLRTRADSDIDFEVVFYHEENGRPAAEPYAKIAATATGVPEGVEAAGRFYTVDASGVTVPQGKSYLGVHWDPSASKFFFVCVDRSVETQRVNVFSMEDRSPRWTEVGDSPDPIFKPHRAIMVRARATPPAEAP